MSARSRFFLFIFLSVFILTCPLFWLLPISMIDLRVRGRYVCSATARVHMWLCIYSCSEPAPQVPACGGCVAQVKPPPGSIWLQSNHAVHWSDLMNLWYTLCWQAVSNTFVSMSVVYDVMVFHASCQLKARLLLSFA